MFVSFGPACLDNLPDGLIITETLSESAVGDLFANASEITGCYDFGSVPSERKQLAFKEILAGVHVRTGFDLKPDAFFAKSGDICFPIPPQILQITPERPMLCVMYSFSVREGESILTGAFVEPDNLSFRLVSVST